MAAWLLLSFVAMTAPLELPRLADAPIVAIRAAADVRCGHANEHKDDLHGGHTAGSASHCPLCTHAAAPQSPQPAECAAGHAPSGPLIPGQRAAVRVRTAAPPPGRGPPVFS